MDKTAANMDMVGYAFKLTPRGINKSKKITVRKDSPISILMSRKTGKLTYTVKPASLSQSDFEGQYPFDKKVKAFLGFPIVNFLNYHEGEISIIAYNKKQGIATYDHLLMETLVNKSLVMTLTCPQPALATCGYSRTSKQRKLNRSVVRH